MNYILIAMVLTFILCWLPLTLVNLVKDYSQFIATLHVVNNNFRTRAGLAARTAFPLASHRSPHCHVACRVESSALLLVDEETEENAIQQNNQHV